MSAEKLYTTEMLAAAVSLAEFPPLQNAVLHGKARAESCGSHLAVDLELDRQGRVETIGMAVHACAVGQAAAAVFARHTKGKSASQIQSAHDQFGAWLYGDGPSPDWPDIALIAPARAYRGRHGAMLLPWKAANAALSSVPASG